MQTILLVKYIVYIPSFISDGPFPKAHVTTSGMSLMEMFEECQYDNETVEWNLEMSTEVCQ